MLIVDTAGRLHVDEELMDELARIRKRTKPHDVLLVVDAMTGQDAVGVAESFAEAAEFDGVVMTKLDGDARGGAALSVKAVTGKPILFASTGEKLEAFERFHPDRMASRILGMGDVLSLIEKAEQQVDEDEAEDLQRKLETEQFTPRGLPQADAPGAQNGPAQRPDRDAAGDGGDETAEERRRRRGRARPGRGDHPLDDAGRAAPTRDSINGSRRKRIANGSGTKVQHVKQLVKQFDQMRVMMKQMATGKPPTPQQIAQMQGGAAAPEDTAAR